MYPFASLPENLAAFCRALNRDHAFHIGPRELADAARAFEIARLGDETAVRHALRPILCINREETAAFDQAFRAFFLLAEAPQTSTTLRRTWGSVAAERRPETTHSPRHLGGHEAAGDASSGAAAQAVEGSGEGAGGPAVVLLSQASAVEGSTEPPAIEPVDEAWRAAARAFVRSVEAGHGRRWRAAPRGPRFDLRRTLRSNLHTGGEMLLTRWRARAPRRLDLVALVDASRSMSGHVADGLRLAVALSGATPHVETFVFSTALRRISREVREAAGGAAQPLPALGSAWGGGTSIGRCLDLFARTEGGLTSRTVVLIMSDGLDTGSPDLLRSAIARLHQQTSGVIWLNPLLHTSGYEPTAQGMRVVRPYLASLTRVATSSHLRQLAAGLRLRGRTI
jgi:uncharacterized protein with von Willebrand factor type A (vWA) domain